MKITIKNLQKKIPISPSISERIKRTFLKTLSLKGTRLSGETTICFINDKRIKELNLKYLHKNSPTDIMVFDLKGPKDKKNILADIVISTDTAISNAKIFNTTALHELYLYVVHGALHILGYNDKNLKQRKIMDAKAYRILTKLNL